MPGIGGRGGGGGGLRIPGIWLGGILRDGKPINSNAVPKHPKSPATTTTIKISDIE